MPSSLGPIAFDRLALSLGAHGVRVSTPGEISHELRKAIDTPAVTVIHLPITGGNPRFKSVNYWRISGLRYGARFGKKSKVVIARGHAIATCR